MVVGEAPGETEDREGKPFVGPAGQLLDDFLRKCGLSRSEVYITNIFKYRPPANDIKRVAEVCDVNQQIELLTNEISSINPNVILALGNTPLKYLTSREGITKYRGSLMLSVVTPRPTKVVPTYHPAYLLRGDGKGEAPFWYRAVVRADLLKAKRESAFPELRRAKKTIKVIRNSGELYEFIRTFNTSGYVSVDIEAHDCIPTCIALSFDRYRACSVPLLKHLSFGDLTGMPTKDIADCWKQIIELLGSGVKVIGQNFKYDQQRLAAIGIRIANFYADTMLMAHTLQPELPKNMGFLASIYTDEEYHKDEGKDFDPRKDNVEQLYVYNGKDAAVTFEIWENLDRELKEAGLHSFYYDHVHRLHAFYSRIEAQGISLDLSKRAELKQKYTELEAQLSKRFDELCSLFGAPRINLNSPKQVARLLFEFAKFPERESTNEETIVALLANHAKLSEQKEILNVILDLRRVRKTIGTYLDAEPDYDGRMRTSIQICGTETGRSSTQILKPPVRFDERGLAFQTITKHGDIGAELRRMLIPDDGYCFLEADLSQAEARIVALLSDDEETLQLFDTTDIHSLTATWISGLPIEAITEDMRFIGKTTRHAGNYGMGKRRFMLDANAAAKRFGIKVSLSEQKAGQILDIFHKKTPKIRAVYHQRVENLIAESRTLIAASGRRRIFHGRWSDDLIREAFAFIPQASVTDHLRKAGFRILERAPDAKIIIEAHDAFALMVPVDKATEIAHIVKEEMDVPFDFSLCSIPKGKLRIPAEVKVGRNLKDFEKLLKK